MSVNGDDAAFFAQFGIRVFYAIISSFIASDGSS
jgi:hypothetical protein